MSVRNVADAFINRLHLIRKDKTILTYYLVLHSTYGVEKIWAMGIYSFCEQEYWGQEDDKYGIQSKRKISEIISI